jgi:hypothetical protein
MDLPSIFYIKQLKIENINFMDLINNMEKYKFNVSKNKGFINIKNDGIYISSEYINSFNYIENTYDFNSENLIKKNSKFYNISKFRIYEDFTLIFFGNNNCFSSFKKTFFDLFANDIFINNPTISYNRLIKTLKNLDIEFKVEDISFRDLKINNNFIKEGKFTISNTKEANNIINNLNKEPFEVGVNFYSKNAIKIYFNINLNTGKVSTKYETINNYIIERIYLFLEELFLEGDYK